MSFFSDDNMVAKYAAAIPAKANAAEIHRISIESVVWISKEAFGPWMKLGDAFVGDLDKVPSPPADGRVEAGLECFARASRARPTSWEPWEAIAATHVHFSRSARALPALMRALELAPDAPQLMRAAANACGRVGRPDKGVAVSERLVGLDPKQASFRAELLGRVKRFDEALALLVVTDDSSRWQIGHRARLLRWAGRAAEELELYQRFVAAGKASWTDVATTLGE